MERRRLVQRVIDELDDNTMSSTDSEQQENKELKRKNSSTASDTTPKKSKSKKRNKSPAISSDEDEELSTPKPKPRPNSNATHGECSRPSNKNKTFIKRATPSSFKPGYKDKNEWEQIEHQELITLGEDKMVNIKLKIIFNLLLN